MICASCGHTLSSETSTCINCSADAYLDGRYRLDEVVGRGASGTTYRATRLEDDEVFAVKELPFHRIESFKTQTLFEREANVLEQLDHPGIPRYVDNFTFGEGKHLTFCLVQEFIEGETLQQEMDGTRYDEREALEILDELLDIVDYLHSRQPPVIHRDIKPKNVMRRDADASLVIIDFGSVRDVLKDPEEGGSTIAGTFGFMAPEQFQGVATPATDMYGLGALTVALMSRKDPQKMLDYTNRLRWEDHVNVHDATRDLLKRMLEPNFNDRASDTGDVEEELARLFDVLDGKDVPATVDVSDDSDDGWEVVERPGDWEPSAEDFEGETPEDALEDDSWRIIIKRTALVMLGLLFAGCVVAVFGVSGDSHEAGSRGGFVSPPSPTGLSTVKRRTLGELGHLSLDMPVAGIGGERVADSQQGASIYETQTVVMRQRAECRVATKDDLVRSIHCNIPRSKFGAGPTSLERSIDYMEAKYGDTRHRAGSPNRWVWADGSTIMVVTTDEASGDVSVRVSRTDPRSDSPEPKEGGRDPFHRE